MRKEADGSPGRAYVYPESDYSYVDGDWVYVLNDDGAVIGSHPTMHVEQVERKAGESAMTSVNPDRSGEEGKIS
jgi:hypothetical protein